MTNRYQPGRDFVHGRHDDATIERQGSVKGDTEHNTVRRFNE